MKEQLTMNWTAFVVTPLMGAVIGYFTNWLAIKMLFRPHAEKRLFGVRLPFTPGLIPKERYKLSKKVGEALYKNVLTEDELAKAISSPEVVSKMENALDNIIADLKAGKYDGQMKKAAAFLSEKAVSILKSPESLSILSLDKVYGKLKNFAVTKGAEYLSGGEFSERLTGYLKSVIEKQEGNEAKLEELLPERLVSGIKRVLAEKTPEAVLFVKTLPDKFSDIDEKLQGLVFKVAQDNFGSFLGIFISYDKIYGKIKASLFDYLDEPANQQFIAEKMTDFFDGLLRREVGGLVKLLPEETRAELAGKIAGAVGNAASGEALGGIFGLLESKLGDVNVYNFISGLIPDFESAVENLIFSAMRGVLDGLSGEREALFKETAVKAVKYVTSKGGAFVAASVEIDKIVENKINDFTVEEAENIIIPIVDRELKAITYLGGLLGLVIGFVPAILNALGM